MTLQLRTTGDKAHQDAASAVKRLMRMKGAGMRTALQSGGQMTELLTPLTPYSEEIAQLARYEIETQSDYFEGCKTNAEEDALVESLSHSIRAAIDSWFYQKSLGL